MNESAVCCFATRAYLPGAAVALGSFRRHCGLPCDYILLTDDPVAKSAHPWLSVHRVDGASWQHVETRQDLFASVCLKYEAFSLPYRRIVVLDSDVLVLSDVTPLLAREYHGHDLIAVRDYGAAHYYRTRLRELKLDPERIVNAGMLICKGDALGTDWRAAFGGIPAACSYDRSDQGYLNYHLQHVAANLNCLHEELRYNYALDPHYPPCPSKAVVHFTGADKPWLPARRPTRYRRLYVDVWKKMSVHQD
jgi:lipopolysaccharide biosynthesis glycosyltransferase